MWRNELNCGFFQNLKKIFLEYKLLLCEPNIEFKKLWEENPLQLTIVLRRIRADMRSKKTVTELVTIAYVFVFFPSNRIFVGFQQPSTRIGHIYSFHSFLHIFSLSLKHKQLESKVFLQRTNLFDKKRETKKKRRANRRLVSSASWESAGLPSGRSRVQTPAWPTLRVFK